MTATSRAVMHLDTGLRVRQDQLSPMDMHVGHLRRKVIESLDYFCAAIGFRYRQPEAVCRHRTRTAPPEFNQILGSIEDL